MRVCLCSAFLVLFFSSGSLNAQVVDNSKASIAALADRVGPDWRAPKGADFIETTKKGNVFLPLDLSRKAVIELSLDSFSSPRFHLRFQSNQAADETYLETWDDTLVLLQGENFQELGRVQLGGPIRLHLRIDPDAEEIAFYSRKQKKLSKASIKMGPPEKQGLWLRNSGEHLIVRDLRVLPWSEREPEERPSPQVIFAGPGKFNEWKRHRAASSPFANLNTTTLVAVRPGSGGFRPIKNFPDRWELRIRMHKREEDEQCKFTVGFDNTGRSRGALTIGANKERRFASRVLERTGGTVLQSTVVGRQHVVFRVFGKKADDSYEITVCTSDGREILVTKIRASEWPRRGRGLSLNMEGTILRPAVISSVELLEWDGAEPTPIPGG